MSKKIIPIGYEDFKQIREKDLYFVDKTLLIQELLESSGQTVLITRPRRFGKTLNLSMLRRYFEDERTEQGEKINNGWLFDGLAISECDDRILQHKQQYPVINLSLKSAKQPNFEMSYGCLIDEICKEFQRHAYVLDMEMPMRNRDIYERIILGKGQPAEYAKSLAFLSECLSKYHKKNVFLLIDEYDVPLENAYFSGYYEEMVVFIRSLFESALKTNPYLERGVITGCLRITRESIFTGLNNLEIHSILSDHYCNRFGFTEAEVKNMLDYYELPEKYEELKQWYDGYQFGQTEIYNPWSISNYVNNARVNEKAFPKAYWSNTSSNSIVKELVECADEETRKEIESLMEGGVIEKPLHEEITYGDIHASKDNLWNFLFFTGYLKATGLWQQDETIYAKMSIPNREIKSIYRQSILTWFDCKVKGVNRIPLIEALENGESQKAEEFISNQLLDTISYFDYAENYYHGFLTGLLTGFKGYEVISNREFGMGRPDIVLKTSAIRKGKVIILEIKVADSVADMEVKCQEALEQIERQKYAEPFVKEGYPVVRKYAGCFYKKECMILEGKYG